MVRAQNFLFKLLSVCHQIPAGTKPPDSGDPTRVTSLLRLDPIPQLVLPIVGATAVYFWEGPSCKSISSSGNVHKPSVEEGQVISADQSMAWRPEQLV